MNRTDTSDKLDSAERRSLPDDVFGLPGKREFPMPDATHVRAAESYFRYASESEKPLLAHRIVMKAREFGVDVESETILGYAAKYRA